MRVQRGAGPVAGKCICLTECLCISFGLSVLLWRHLVGSREDAGNGSCCLEPVPLLAEPL